MNPNDPPTGQPAQPNEARATGAPVHPPALPSRRTWLRTGLKATPAVLTLASQPVLAWQCTTPSAHASVTVASRAARSLLTYSLSPGTCTDWKNKFNYPLQTINPTGGTGPLLIPYPCNPLSTCNVLMGSGSTSTIRYVLNSGTAWEKAMVTAMLNARCGRIESACASVSTLMAMWQGGDSYSPSAGKFWSKAQVVDYLTTTGFARP